MKLIERKFALTLLAGAALSMGIFAGCSDGGSSGGDGEGENVSTENIFQSYSPGSITVDNMTNQRLVAFKGEISSSNLISGIPADVRGHRLKLDTTLFNTSCDFSLYLITEEQYNENKNDLTKIKNSPYQIVYAFYDKKNGSNISFPINKYVDGDSQLLLSNATPMKCELRLNSPQGNILCYIGDYETQKMVKINTGDYDFYPTFKRFVVNSVTGEGEVYPFKPKLKSGGPLVIPVAIDEKGGVLDLRDWYNPDKCDLSTGGFYLTVNNQSRIAIQFRNGNTEFASSIGLKGISRGTQRTFFVSFEKLADGTYPSENMFSQLNIYASGYTTEIPAGTFKLDTRYSITVTGSAVDELNVGEITEEGVLNINEILGL